MTYTCPCCGYQTLNEKPPGTYDIYSICFGKTMESNLTIPTMRAARTRCHFDKLNKIISASVLVIGSFVTLSENRRHPIKKTRTGDRSLRYCNEMVTTS